MPSEVIEQVNRAAATGESVSGWQVSAALEALEQSGVDIARIETERKVVDYEEEFGPIPPEVHADVDEFFSRVKESAG